VRSHVGAHHAAAIMLPKRKRKDMDNFQNYVVDGLGDDLVIRMCLAGQGEWAKLDYALRDNGFSRAPEPLSGWPNDSLKRINRLLKQGTIKRLSRGLYVACCPNCGTEIMNVTGMEH
jgi:hypothetical protein